MKRATAPNIFSTWRWPSPRRNDSGTPFSLVRGDTPALATAARSFAAAAPSRPHRWSPRHSIPPFLSPSPVAAVRSAHMAREAAASPRARAP
eukprot:3060123-Alexandrium_andersonii.AAC.1